MVNNVFWTKCHKMYCLFAKNQYNRIEWVQCVRFVRVQRKENEMIQTNVFDYINVLDKAADASWLRNDAISNNIANVDTPGYKRQDVAFESVLKQALGMSRYTTMDDKVGSLKVNQLRPRTYTDYAGFAYRIDGNNVDIDNEEVMLAENQLKYQGLMTSINQEFANLQTVMK